MEIDEDEDFYAPEETAPDATADSSKSESELHHEVNNEAEDGDLEEGEEEEEDGDSGDSDIDIITERKESSKISFPSQAKYNEIRNIPQRTSTGDIPGRPVIKKLSAKNITQISGSDLPGVAVSKINVNAKPIYEPGGKPITQINIDEDLPENEKPWRRPGTDITDYFNYGFDEFTWALYASKQEAVRSEYSADKIALNSKKLFEDMNMMMAMGAMPPIVPGTTGGTQMPGIEGMDMQSMMQQMVAAGIDPTQIDSAAMFAAMQANQGATRTTGGVQGGNQGQGYTGQVNFGQAPNQYVFDQNMANSADRSRGGNLGRGRGRRGW